jgi:hypothetical protein
MNYPVERKNIYTSLLINTLAPCIYEGLLSIYNDIKIKTKDNGKELKTFQECLATIPKWNNDVINMETNRILQKSKCPWLEDLMKGVIKSNIELLSNTTSSYGFKYLNEKMYKNARLNNFIHKCYIECAREIYNNPYLFYHKYKTYQIKNNQKEIIILIKDCIDEAIKKMLPLKNILEEYINRDFIIEDINYDNTKKSISNNDFSTELDESHINELVKRDILNKIDDLSINTKPNVQSSVKQDNQSIVKSDNQSVVHDSKSIIKPDDQSIVKPENKESINDSLDTQRLIQSTKRESNHQYSNKSEGDKHINKSINDTNQNKSEGDKIKKYVETYSNIDEMRKNNVFVSNESTLKESIKNDETNNVDKLQYFKKYLEY